MKVGAFLESDVDERCLDSAENRVHAAEVDIADRSPLVRAIDQQFDEAVVLEDGNTGFAGGARYQNFALHGGLWEDSSQRGLASPIGGTEAASAGPGVSRTRVPAASAGGW